MHHMKQTVSSALTIFASSPVLQQTFLVPDYEYVGLGITPPTHPYTNHVEN